MCSKSKEYGVVNNEGNQHLAQNPDASDFDLKKQRVEEIGITELPSSLGSFKKESVLLEYIYEQYAAATTTAK
jgi:hypothetical protein